MATENFTTKPSALRMETLPLC
ncbi:hypothetical protein CTRU02_208184 [Colletotrichum truncatum]|uniref:Uncharacterized protein n=1 Tax=Colletotrichum truncatum TaxID=5467 RepID=A0ACC3YVM9_COLTU|nr:hypothetical protein CTRU02_07636 [Colletotrichum truncatum]